MLSLPDFAPFLKELALELNEMKPALPRLAQDPIYCEFQSPAELGVARQHYRAGEHVVEVIAANRPAESPTDYFSGIEGRPVLCGGLGNAGLR